MNDRDHMRDATKKRSVESTECDRTAPSRNRHGGSIISRKRHSDKTGGQPTVSSHPLDRLQDGSSRETMSTFRTQPHQLPAVDSTHADSGNQRRVAHCTDRSRADNRSRASTIHQTGLDGSQSGKSRENDRSPLVLANSRSVGSSYERYEREANRIAGSVFTSSVVAPTPSRIRRRRRSGNRLHRLRDQDGQSPVRERVNDVISSPGRPLDPSTKQSMEALLGHSFDSVRIHTGRTATRSARDLDAKAYTVGTHIVFDHNEFDPHTVAGSFLLAHELVHVIQ